LAYTLSAGALLAAGGSTYLSRLTPCGFAPAPLFFSSAADRLRSLLTRPSSMAARRARLSLSAFFSALLPETLHLSPSLSVFPSPAFAVGSDWDSFTVSFACVCAFVVSRFRGLFGISRVATFFLCADVEPILRFFGWTNGGWFSCGSNGRSCYAETCCDARFWFGTFWMGRLPHTLHTHALRPRFLPAPHLPGACARCGILRAC